MIRIVVFNNGLEMLLDGLTIADLTELIAKYGLKEYKTIERDW